MDEEKSAVCLTFFSEFTDILVLMIMNEILTAKRQNAVACVNSRYGIFSDKDDLEISQYFTII